MVLKEPKIKLFKYVHKLHTPKFQDKLWQNQFHVGIFLLTRQNQKKDKHYESI